MPVRRLSSRASIPAIRRLPASISRRATFSPTILTSIPATPRRCRASRAAPATGPLTDHVATSVHGTYGSVTIGVEQRHARTAVHRSSRATPHRTNDARPERRKAASNAGRPEYGVRWTLFGTSTDAMRRQRLRARTPCGQPAGPRQSTSTRHLDLHARQQQCRDPGADAGAARVRRVHLHDARFVRRDRIRDADDRRHRHQRRADAGRERTQVR